MTPDQLMVMYDYQPLHRSRIFFLCPQLRTVEHGRIGDTDTHDNFMYVCMYRKSDAVLVIVHVVYTEPFVVRLA